MQVSDFENIYRSKYRSLYLYAGDFIAEREVCRDIISDVFAQLWARRHEIDPETVDAYLRSAVRNACISYLRRQNRRRELSPEFLNLTDTQQAQLDSMDTRLEDLQKAISLLPERTRFALEQCALNKKSYQETAQMMNISPDGVRFHIKKAYAFIRQYFKDITTES